VTAIVEVNLVCDGRGRDHKCPTREFLVFATQSIKTARILAAREGWRVFKQTEGTGTKTRDSCGKCAPLLSPWQVLPSRDHKPALSAADLIGDVIQRRKT
jgi:hypothetical protein